MNDASEKPTSSLWRSARAFAGDFVHFAGRRALWVGGLVATGALLESVGIVLIIPLLAVVMSPEVGGGRFQRMVQEALAFTGAQSQLSKLAVLFAVFIALMLVRGLVLMRRDIRITELRVYFLESRREQLMRRLAAATWSRLSRLRHARIMHAMGGEVQSIGFAAHLVLQCSVAAVMIVVQIGLAFFLSPLLATFAVLLLGTGALALSRVLRRAHRLGSESSAANLKLMDSTSQFLGGLKLAMSQNLQARFIAEARQTLEQIAKRQVDYVRHQSQSRVMLATAPAVAAAFIVLVGIGVIGMPPAVLIAFLLILLRTVAPVAQIQQSVQQLVHSLPAYDKLKELEAELGNGELPQFDTASVPLADPIVFRGVSYRHEADGAGISDVSVTLEPRTFIGISGASGSGKTTFADHLVGLIVPDAGTITLGERPLAGDTLETLRASMSYVSQDPFLFHDTLRRNLSWVRPGVTEAEMWQALALFGAEDLVRRNPLGLDAIIGDRGTTVSGGERQRLALARAILRKPSLLILDEAMNALDRDSEHAIIGRLLALEPKLTIVMITHRPESLARCDRVLEFDGGRLTIQR